MPERLINPAMGVSMIAGNGQKCGLYKILNTAMIEFFKLGNTVSLAYPTAFLAAVNLQILPEKNSNAPKRIFGVRRIRG